MRKFFNELKRRNVVKAGLAYIVLAWLTIQVAETLLPTFEAPAWVLKTLVLFVAIGFPFVLLFAWAFEITPEGIKKTEDVDLSASITGKTGQTLNYVTIAALSIAVVYFVWERQTPAPAALATVATEPAPAAKTQTDEAAPDKTIAVLPFDDLSPGGDQEWFADGLAEEILNSLARTPDLQVAARTSSFVYKDSREDIRNIAESLGVGHVLEGSVRRSPDRLRVTAQLIRAADGFHLWSDTFDRKPDDMIEIQENVAVEIARALKTAMDPEALERMTAAGTHSVPAYEAYLEGLSYGLSSISTGDSYEYVGARDAFERAVEIDPEFSDAYFALASLLDFLRIPVSLEHGLVDIPPDEISRMFDEAIANAVRTARDDTTRLRNQAFQAFRQNRLATALRLNTEYIEQRPNDLDAPFSQMHILTRLGRHEQLKEAIDEFTAKDGFDSWLSAEAVMLARITGDREFMLRHANAALQRKPDDMFLAYQAHRIFLWNHDLDRASRLLPRILESNLPDWVPIMANARQACAENRLDDADRLITRLETEYADDPWTHWAAAQLRGDYDGATAVLKNSSVGGNLRDLLDFTVYPSFDARAFPELVEFIEAEGGEVHDPVELTFQCHFPADP